MQFDVFLSISQTPDHAGYTPDEPTMYRNFFDQVEAADHLGFGTAWIAQSHLSTTAQQADENPVVPHWNGEVGLCTDFFSLAARVFERTQRIDVGSAVIAILAAGGPIPTAERIGAFLALHGLDPNEHRRLRIGFAAGRFEFMARPYGIIPRDEVEAAAWPALRGQIFAEASEIFLRLLNGETLHEKDISPTILSRENFRSDEDWEKVLKAHAECGGTIDDTTVKFAPRYSFEHVKTTPSHWRRELLDLILGSHDTAVQIKLNKWLPVKVFNLSITQPDIIEAAHERMKKYYHSDGGGWKREYMPRTVMVFLNHEPGLSEDERRLAAQEEAHQALGSYWQALEGTIDPMKVAKATNNAVIGTVDDVCEQIAERFDAEDSIMAWFDFFKHDSARVVRDMTAFAEHVMPVLCT